MKKVSLSGSARQNVGKKDATELRQGGRVPCVIYGAGTQTHFHVEYESLRKIVWSPDVFEVEIELEGKKHRSVIQDLQFHPVSDKVVHVDFLEVLTDKPVKIKLPVKVIGTAEGVKKGGRLLQNFRKLHVVGKIDDMPESIDINVETMEIGDDVRVKDMTAKGLRFLDTPSAVVVSVQTSRKVAEEPVAEKPAAPAAEGAAAEAPADKDKK